MKLAPAVVAVLALGAACLAIAVLEGERAGLRATPLEVPDGTPATVHHRPGIRSAPVVVIAHGFAGSRQLMASYALTLARAGYLAVTFDYLGHGRNPDPMEGDVTRVDGTTRLLMAETERVARAALALPASDGRLAYVGHSMASDIVVRQALETPPAQATAAISLFSRAVTPAAPANLLVVVGALEGRLRDEALRVLHLAAPAASEGETVGDPADGSGRRVVFAPGVEHVGVLYSPTALRETRAWLDATFGRRSEGPVAARGGWIALLLLAILAVAWPLSRLLPEVGTPPARLAPGPFALTALAPALVVPLALWPFETHVLPVLVADYLALHFALYGALTLLLLWRHGRLAGQVSGAALLVAGAVALFGIAVFGGALDRYVASFFPHPGRVPIIAGLALGTVPYMLGDAILTQGGRASLWRVLLLRGAFLGSLALAVALDFEDLFFLVVIMPVIVLFYLIFGTMAGWVGRHTGAPAAGGIGIGVVLAWALGCTFPLIAS